MDWVLTSQDQQERSNILVMKTKQIHANKVQKLRIKLLKSYFQSTVWSQILHMKYLYHMKKNLLTTNNRNKGKAITVKLVINFVN